MYKRQLYKEFEARVSEALEEFVTSQFDDDGTRRERMDELSARTTGPS